MNKINFLVIILIISLLPQGLFAYFPGVDSPTFEERRESYLTDDGNSYRQDFPAGMLNAVWAWLENPEGHAAEISQEIDYLLGDTCYGFNCWWTGNWPQPIWASYIYYKYYQDNKVISDSDAEKIRKKIFGVANMGSNESQSEGFFSDGAANFFYMYQVVAYLYASRVGGLPQAHFNAGSFTYDDRSYQAGNYYEAEQLYSDFLSYKMDDLLRNGNKEDFGDYYWFQVQAIIALYDLAPDPIVKAKAKMLSDWLIFNSAVSLSAGHWAGGHGRIYQEFHERGGNYVPFSGVYFSFSQEELEKTGAFWPHLFISDYRFPDLMTGIVEKINGLNAWETDDYYRIIRGSIPRMGKWGFREGEINFRYDYVTPLFNLGGTGIGTGWELNIAPYFDLGEKTPFRLWVNHCPEDADRSCFGPQSNWGYFYLGIMGAGGFQNRNSLFISGTHGNLHIQMASSNWWSEQAGSGPWQFFRKGNLMIAINVSSHISAHALEVAIRGFDYPDFRSFMEAVTSNTKVTWYGFVNSKGVRIFPDEILMSNGYPRHEYVDLGSDFTELPFDRLEVWEGHLNKNDEEKIVDWDSNIMTVRQGDNFCQYDFNTWTLSGNDCQTGMEDVVTGYGADFNCDEQIDIFDFGILLSHWGTDASAFTSFCGNQPDLNASGQIDISDIAIFFEKWINQ